MKKHNTNNQNIKYLGGGHYCNFIFLKNKLNKKGFTLIELLGVIVILVIVVLIAVPSIMSITKPVKNNMLDKKIKIIKQAAILYGEDNKEELINSSIMYEDNPCIHILVSFLVPNYIDKDNKKECFTEGCIVDPSQKDKYLDKKVVIIYYKNKGIHAIMGDNINLAAYLYQSPLTEKSGLNKKLEGGMFRYQGKSIRDLYISDDVNSIVTQKEDENSVNNYICFGTSDKNECTSKIKDKNGLTGQDKYMYRIIGVNENKEVKLIKMRSIRDSEGKDRFAWHSNNSVNVMWGPNPADSTKPNSSLREGLNGAFFLNKVDENNNKVYVPDTWMDMIKDTEWKYGDIGYETLDANNNLVIYGQTPNANGKSAEGIYNIENGWTNTTTAKIGLMYLHDYYYASKSGGEGDNCIGKKCTDYEDSWIHISKNHKDDSEWTMSRNGYGEHTGKYYAWRVSANGGVYNQYLQYTNHTARPVFYLTSQTLYKGGKGTQDDPFIIGKSI